jgi:hypothetical protein
MRLNRNSDPTEVEMKYSQNKTGGRTGNRWLLLAAMVPLLAFTTACDNLLDVSVPGFVTVDALDDPDLAETLVLSAVGDFECGFVDYMRYPGQWYELFLNTSGSRPDGLSGVRSALVDVYADPCDSGTGPVWSVMQLPRQQAKRAINYMETVYEAGSVTDQELLVAQASLYEGYSTQLLSEQFCAITRDGGPLESRAAGFAAAEGMFSKAITQATAALAAGQSGAQTILDAAYVGRARAKLYQGLSPVADAQLVTSGFQMMATYETSPGRRNNRIVEYDNVGDAIMPHEHYARLTIEADGTLTQSATYVPAGGAISDPRVPIDEPAGVTENRGLLQKRAQEKYSGEGSDIPFATWREAQLMIAESQQGASAVTIINSLRANTTGLYSGLDSSAWPLPAYAGATDAASVLALVTEERRRELWMQGTHSGDKNRFAGTQGYPGWEAQDEYGQAQSPGKSWPVPFLEISSNNNVPSISYASNNVDCT